MMLTYVTHQTITSSSFHPISLQPMLGIFTLLVKNRMINDISSQTTQWDISCAGEKIRSKIIKESRFINIVTIVNVSFSVVAMLSFIYPNPNDYFVLFTHRILWDWFPEHHLFVEVVFRPTYFAIFVVTTAHALQVVYCTQRGRFQLYLLNKYIDEISEYDELEENLMYDECYQEEISFRLKFCISRQNERNR
jgi:hypothetical protein